MFSHSWMIQSSVQKPLMDQSKPCAICLTPVPNNTKLWCCGQPCHTPCANKLQINLIPRRCPGCRRNVIVSTDPPHSPCVFCSIQVHNNATLRCCDKPCHPSCAMECNKPNPSPSHAPIVRTANTPFLFPSLTFSVEHDDLALTLSLGRKLGKFGEIIDGGMALFMKTRTPSPVDTGE